MLEISDRPLYYLFAFSYCPLFSTSERFSKQCTPIFGTSYRCFATFFSPPMVQSICNIKSPYQSTLTSPSVLSSPPPLLFLPLPPNSHPPSPLSVSLYASSQDQAKKLRQKSCSKSDAEAT
ncbi:hypothetical protein AMTRI_Chr04g186860 [Amborella trichopoda]